jgi:hypothetical protein
MPRTTKAGCGDHQLHSKNQSPFTCVVAFDIGIRGYHMQLPEVRCMLPSSRAGSETTTIRFATVDQCPLHVKEQATLSLTALGHYMVNRARVVPSTLQCRGPLQPTLTIPPPNLSPSIVATAHILSRRLGALLMMLSTRNKS